MANNISNSASGILTSIPSSIANFLGTSNLEESNLSNLANKDIHKIGNVLSGIFTQKDNFTNIDAPRLVVVGTQSSGKSSLLNSILNMDIMPMGKNMVTRTPLNIQLIQSDKDSYAEFGKYDSGKWVSKKKINFSNTFPSKTEISLVHDQINVETIERAGEGMNISQSEIILQITSPSIPNLSMVDLPGLTMVACTDKGQPKDIKEQICKMISNYIDNERSIILAVIPARPDIEADPALELIKRYDPESTRTVGVFTKIDLMNLDTDIGDYITGDISKDLKFKYGYYAVKNRGPSELADLDINRALKKEQYFFDNHPIYSKLDNNKFGIPNLIKNLSNIVIENIRKSLPSILQELSKKKNELDLKLETLGPSLPDSEEEKISHLNVLIANFCRDFSKSINKRGELINTGRKIKELFIKFRVDLEKVQPFSSDIYPDEYIVNAIENYDGNHMSFNVFPVEVLESCLKDPVKRPINSLLSPCSKCLKLVHIQLLDSVDLIFENNPISKFTVLKNTIKDEINKILNFNILPTNKQIQDQILIEENYIWTDETIFIDKLQEILPKNTLNQMNPTVIRELLNAYYKTIVKKLSDQIPKIIMFYFINATEKDIYVKLFSNLNNNNIIELLQESNETSNKRKEITVAWKNITNAINLIKSY